MARWASLPALVGYVVGPPVAWGRRSGSGWGVVSPGVDASDQARCPGWWSGVVAERLRVVVESRVVAVRAFLAGRFRSSQRGGAFGRSLGGKRVK